MKSQLTILLATMKANWIKLLATISAFLMPISGLLFLVGFVILLDTITGVWKSIKNKVKITSRGLSAIISKMLLYEVTVIMFYMIDQFILNHIILQFFSVELLLTKVLALILVSIEILQERLSNAQYFHEESEKKQIYLHHTAGNGNPVAVSRWWNSNGDRIATAFVIGERGSIVQCFSSKHWAYHLGIDSQDFSAHGLKYQNLNKLSVGIEVCNWGPLKLKDGKYYNYVKGVVDPSMVTTLDTPYKGNIHWYKYTDEQIESTRQLVEYLCDTYDIPKTYRSEIFAIDKEAFKGTAGIYTHNSVRKDKADIYPCPRMIKMLQSL
jgi:hypothetical protein